MFNRHDLPFYIIEPLHITKNDWKMTGKDKYETRLKFLILSI